MALQYRNNLFGVFVEYGSIFVSSTGQYFTRVGAVYVDCQNTRNAGWMQTLKTKDNQQIGVAEMKYLYRYSLDEMRESGMHGYCLVATGPRESIDPFAFSPAWGPLHVPEVFG